MSRTKHRIYEPTAEDLICDRIHQRITALVEPSTTRTYSWVLSEDKSKLVRQANEIEHAPLIEQLAEAVGGSTAGAASASGYTSKPAANLEPIDALVAMRRGAAVWVRSAFRKTPTDLPENLRLIAARAHVLVPEHLRALDRDVLGWWARARIVTTWDVPPMKPYVRCDSCGEIGGIQVRTDPLAAVCLRCHAAWDEATIGILGTHVQIVMAAPILDPALERAAADLNAYLERCTCAEVYADNPTCPACFPVLVPAPVTA
jgi:hypothetical protein